MEAAYASFRKCDFPASVSEALRHVHKQCQSFSKTGIQNPQEMTQLLDFIDDFIFSHPRSGKQQKSRRFTSVQQLQLIQILSEYFSSDADFSLLCSVFMVVFMTKGRDVDFKVQTLSRLVCVSLGTAQLALLNCTGLWMAQQGPGSDHCLAVARALLADCLTLLPEAHTTSLSYLPVKSPLLAANLLVAFGELYSATAGGGPPRTTTTPPLLSDSAPAVSVASAVMGSFRPPPIEVVRLAAAWLKDNPELCGGQGSTPHQGTLPITGVTPAGALIVWTVLEPLVCQEEDREAYSRLHFILLQSLQEPACRSSISGQQLGQLTETLLSIFSSRSFTEETVNQCMDRYGQILQAAITARSPVERDLVTLANQLPANRLLQIVLASLPQSSSSLS